MRARLREGLAQFFAKLKEHALEWAAIALCAPALSVVLMIEDWIALWVATLNPIWIVRSFVALLAAFWVCWIWWLWTAPRRRFDDLTGTYLDLNDDKDRHLRYCVPCSDQKKRLVPMRNEDCGWRCLTCKQYFPDPARGGPLKLRTRKAYRQDF